MPCGNSFSWSAALDLESPERHISGCVSEGVSREVYREETTHPERGWHHSLVGNPDRREKGKGQVSQTPALPRLKFSDHEQNVTSLLTGRLPHIEAALTAVPSHHGGLYHQTMRQTIPSLSRFCQRKVTEASSSQSPSFPIVS